MYKVSYDLCRPSYTNELWYNYSIFFSSLFGQFFTRRVCGPVKEDDKWRIRNNPVSYTHLDVYKRQQMNC